MLQGIDFVVDDAFINTAYDTFQDAGFKNCKSEDCIGNKKLFYAPTPLNHLHITESEHLNLYKRSDILWRLPDLVNMDGERLILASDFDQLPGPDMLGRRGRFQHDLHPVRILSVYQVVRALLLLAKKDQITHGGYWMNWVGYILEYCTKNGVFDKS